MTRSTTLSRDVDGARRRHTTTVERTMTEYATYSVSNHAVSTLLQSYIHVKYDLPYLGGVYVICGLDILIFGVW